MNHHILLFLCLPFLAVSTKLLCLTHPFRTDRKADAVIRDHRIDFTVTAPGQATLREYRAVTVFNENTNYNMMVVHYSPYNKVKRITGKVYDANGKLIRQLKKMRSGTGVPFPVFPFMRTTDTVMWKWSMATTPLRWSLNMK